MPKFFMDLSKLHCNQADLVNNKAVQMIDRYVLGSFSGPCLISAAEGSFFLSAFLEDLNDIEAVKNALFAQVATAGSCYFVTVISPKSSVIISRLKAGLTSAGTGAVIAKLFTDSLDQNPRIIIKVVTGAIFGTAAYITHGINSLPLELHGSEFEEKYWQADTHRADTHALRAKLLGKELFNIASTTGTMWMVVKAINVCFFNSQNPLTKQDQFIIAAAIAPAEILLSIIRKNHHDIWLLCQRLKALVLNFGSTLKAILIAFNVGYYLRYGEFPDDLSQDTSYRAVGILLAILNGSIEALRIFNRNKTNQAMQTSNDLALEEIPANTQAMTSSDDEAAEVTTSTQSNWQYWKNYFFCCRSRRRQNPDLWAPLISQYSNDDQPHTAVASRVTETITDFKEKKVRSGF